MKVERVHRVYGHGGVKKHVLKNVGNGLRGGLVVLEGSFGVV